jgi:pimeloyl-ACP methyl ester carboxylesterase
MMKNLILVPALGCNDQLYAEITPALSTITNIQTIIPTATRYDTMVKQLLSHAPDKFAILGTSMGGRLALETTLAAPDRVQGLIIIGAGPGPVADQTAGLARSARIRGTDFETVIAEMADMVSHRPGPNGEKARNAFIRMAREVGPETMANQSDALAYRIDRWRDLASITCPTLFLWGHKDRFSPCEDAVRMNGIVTGSRCVVIPNCGHFPTLEYPERSTAIMLDWFRDKLGS